MRKNAVRIFCVALGLAMLSGCAAKVDAPAEEPVKVPVEENGENDETGELYLA